MKLKLAFKKATKSLWKSIPIFLGTILLVSIITTIVPKEFYIKALSHQKIILDSFLGAVIGSVSTGSPIISYIIGGKLLEQSISLIVVTAFLLAWVTVGFIQIPAEIKFLGKKFTFWRNLTAFILAIIAAPLIVILASLI